MAQSPTMPNPEIARLISQGETPKFLKAKLSSNLTAYDTPSEHFIQPEQRVDGNELVRQLQRRGLDRPADTKLGQDPIAGSWSLPLHELP